MEFLDSQYEIIKKLGGGSFGTVYLVRHKEGEELLAIKVLLDDLAQDGEALSRFKREGLILKNLNHPAIIQLRDFDKADSGQYYMVLDYCPGISLQGLLKKQGHLPCRTVLELAVEVLEVLALAHKQGVIHRDLKPENLMVDTDERGKQQIKVLDFGIAKLKKFRGSLGEELSTLTGQGVLIGTPLYMSPEQAYGDEADGQSDLYTLGMVMYHLLTGVKPFESEEIPRLLLLQATKDPRPFREVAPHLDLPGPIEQLVFRAIQKDKTKRFQNAQEFLGACKRVEKKISRSFSAGKALVIAIGVILFSVFGLGERWFEKNNNQPKGVPHGSSTLSPPSSGPIHQSKPVAKSPGPKVEYKIFGPLVDLRKLSPKKISLLMIHPYPSQKDKIRSYLAKILCQTILTDIKINQKKFQNLARTKKISLPPKLFWREIQTLPPSSFLAKAKEADIKRIGQIFVQTKASLVLYISFSQWTLTSQIQENHPNYLLVIQRHSFTTKALWLSDSRVLLRQNFPKISLEVQTIYSRGRGQGVFRVGEQTLASLRVLSHKLGRVVYPVVVKKNQAGLCIDPRTLAENPLQNDLTWND